MLTNERRSRIETLRVDSSRSLEYNVLRVAYEVVPVSASSSLDRSHPSTSLDEVTKQVASL